ncbi:ATP-binding cassette domain-containing protein [candidate division KSB3 bacterium]|uniref:ATP-binding cassette domain-containing protein n=1 Tax=candidate division KSB3 bacterium TaxID=2044937 RepID=A0A9D5JV50_9BACT|nr:ATP-binding cassette domain-containing protein [candidate division KSB3 bacterium]MBD3324502.1 ATP-binding cassette domain-containing protein [candidate division KSB3 bacterium]
MSQDITFKNVTFRYPIASSSVFENLSLTLSKGVTAFVGQNGTGKTTLLLLAAGLLLPTEGKVYVQGVDTADLHEDEQRRQRYVSFIYQNMEFETEEPIESLLHFVYEQGFYEQPEPHFIDTLIHNFELEHCLAKKTQEISKGELQRVILAFSLLYGSRIVIMDEPIFAMEGPQKYHAMRFLTDFAKQRGVSLYYAVHELDISQRYSDFTVLLKKDDSLLYGRTPKVLTRERLEEAYEIPLVFLKQKEMLYRHMLKVKDEEKRKHFLN